jgi:lipoprotein NlpI
MIAQEPYSIGDQAQLAESGLSRDELNARGLTALGKGDNAAAIAAADAMIAKWPDGGVVARVAGDLYLRAGRVEPATQQFNRYVKEQPRQLPYLWQRGISLYFTGDYDEATEQFEVHRTVNPNDVENAAWHFLCVAKSQSVEQAKQLVLPAPGDPRPPMKEVLEMLSSGDREAVIARVEALPIGSDDRKSAAFYADFYLGLYADALGETKTAQKYLTRAAKDAPHNYMGDVARVYAGYLKAQVLSDH